MIKRRFIGICQLKVGTECMVTWPKLHPLAPYLSPGQRLSSAGSVSIHPLLPSSPSVCLSGAHPGGGGAGVPPWDLKSTIFSGFLPLNSVICIFSVGVLKFFAMWKDWGSLQCGSELTLGGHFAPYWPLYRKCSWPPLRRSWMRPCCLRSPFSPSLLVSEPLSASATSSSAGAGSLTLPDGTGSQLLVSGMVAGSNSSIVDCSRRARCQRGLVVLTLVVIKTVSLSREEAILTRTGLGAIRGL